MIRAILLIVIDCLRADHVSCYGYPRPTTPTIDALASDGCLWERASSVSSWTKPSVASLLTGLYPTQHGAFRGVKRSKPTRSATTDILRSPLPTLAESLSERGWRCGAFAHNEQLGEFTQLNRGFAPYLPTAGQADRLIGVFLEWLEANLRAPVFAYLHFLDTHWPYKPRRRHVAMFGGNRDTNVFRNYTARDYGKLRRAISHGERTLTPEELEQMAQMYDGAIRRIDSKLRIILAMLTELGLRDQTAIFITSDHGEELMDHGQIGHGHSLHEELIHVPLIASVPGGPGSVRCAQPVSQVDLARTVECLAQVDPKLPGCNLLDFSATPRPACSELLIRRRYTQAISTDQWKLHQRYKFDVPEASVSGTQTPRDWIDDCPYKRRHELYDLITDPHERVNLADQPEHAQSRSALSEELDRWWRNLPVPMQAGRGGEVEIDAEVVQRLQDLGYLD